MPGIQILDVGIGLALVYLLLSILCSAIREGVAAVSQTRAKMLEQALRSMIPAKGTEEAKDRVSVDALYKHPLIQSLWDGKRRPSYIPPRAFALTLLDLAVPPEEPGAEPRGFDAIRKSVSTLADPPRRVLLALVDEAEGKRDQVLANIETWFNGAMERASGWYKRRTQATVLVLALVVTVALNADSAMMANRLWRDAAVRQSVVKAAEKAVQTPPPAPGRAQSVAEAMDDVGKGVDKVEQLGLLPGWRNGVGFALGAEKPETFTWAWALAWLLKLMGWLLTAAAVSLGAPFWFDMLNKLVNLRSSGKKPEPEKKDEPAKKGGTA